VDYAPGGLWGYFGIFVVIYAVIFAIEMLIDRAKVRRANEKLKEKEDR